VAGPLGADFHIGLAPEHDHRVSPVIAPPPAPAAGADGGSSPLRRTARSAAITAADASTPQWRRAEIPAAGGHGNARSVAAVQSVLACGGTARGVRLLSEAGCERALEEQFRGVDQVLGVPMRYGQGYGLHGGWLPNPRACFWGGAGGSLVIVDLDARMTVSYVMNQMLDRGTVGDDRAIGVVFGAYAGLPG